MSSRRAYIAGCQRSGTTLMRLVLESHTRVACLDEKDVYRLLIRKDGTFGRDTPTVDDRDVLAMKIPRFAEQLLTPRMSDPDYGEFDSFYRGEPVLFLLRDPRDVISSMMSLAHPSGGTWLTVYGPKILKHKCQEAPFRQRYAKLLQRLDSADWPEHLVGALYWVYKTDAVFDYLGKLPVLPVGYERLTSEPKPVLERIVGFLGLAWEDALLHHHEQDHGQLRTDGRAIGLTDPAAPIHARSVGRHERDLPPDRSAEVMDLTGASWSRAQELIAEGERTL